MTGEVTVICGGVGAARMLAALCRVAAPETFTAVVNTGDDAVLNGLSVSPDLDTITYTLGDAIDPDRGWGLVDESWRTMEALARYAAVRPEGSAAAQTWFGLGDRDLATHLYRATRLGEGATLTEATDEIRRAWGVGVRILPMSDERVSTRVRLGDGRWLGFQEYFVGHRHAVVVTAVDVDVETTAARLTDGAAMALAGAELVVIAPSNPILSIAPVRALPDTDRLLADRRDTVVAVSPIVGGVALKGPADRLLAELGHEPSVVGVARLYAPIASVLVIDPADAALADAVEAVGMRPLVTPSVMSSPEASAALARAVLTAARA